ncbi:hypothetical protein tinsulaeT_00820 [Thalassotalea insulae]|uniref:Metallo-beta-lactamase domain-containing protein n=1 Tax=Thalassotalea insulae TaxID=2056778 RepID=A0ABQ6GQB4_9GAMM|nr:MBL fold metallo-hydrolase [Thalassotalea insulae]GLX76742.1 hypothetical protein tinsulaeT_00820 [Thalassotalea insulae]
MAWQLLLLSFFLGSIHVVGAHDFHSPEPGVNDNKARGKQLLIEQGVVQYLGNEALLVATKQQKILFDPFFHDNIGIYQLVPDKVKQAMFAGAAPFDDVDAVFISHAHRDHFAVDSVARYLQNFTQVKLYASQQAITQLTQYMAEQQLSIAPSRMIAVDLQLGDDVWQQKSAGLAVSAIRIPHAGWPSRADVENILFQVVLNDNVSVMHMGDADPDVQHYLPYRQHWRQHTIDINFPPYWFFFSAEGRDILTDIISADSNVGIHVPMKVPNQLKSGQYQYFSTVGDSKTINRSF